MSSDAINDIVDKKKSEKWKAKTNGSAEGKP